MALTLNPFVALMSYFSGLLRLLPKTQTEPQILLTPFGIPTPLNMVGYRKEFSLVELMALTSMQ